MPDHRSPGAGGSPLRPRTAWLLRTLLLTAVPGLALEAQATTVILVRHAEKAAATGDPELSDAGRERARALARSLAGFRLDGIIVSQFRRTLQTATPTAEAQHLLPVTVPSGEDLVAGAEAVAAALRRMHPGSSALVVGHSNTIGPIIAALGGPRLPDLCDGEHATLFLLQASPDGGPSRLLRVSYGTPDPPTQTDCPAAARP